MFAREGGLGALVGLVAGVVDSELGVGSLGDAPEVGFVAVSCRGRFGSGVGVVGSVCRLRPWIRRFSDHQVRLTVHKPFGGRPESMTVWFGATSNQGATASVEFALTRMNKSINIIIKEDTNREEDLFETGNGPDSYNTVVYLSLQRRVREQE